MNLLTYGTLQFDDVWLRVAGRPLTTVPGEAAGYGVYRVDGREYPGMTPEPGATAAGTVYLDVDDETLARLDVFEGDEYTRLAVRVTCADGVDRECEAYVIPSESRRLLTDEPWTRESFLASGALERFLLCYAGFFRSE